MYKIMNGMDNGTQSYTEDEVYEMLQQDFIYHDYSYMMSDDDTAYRVGARTEKCIREMLHILIGVCKMDAEALYSEAKSLAGEDYTDYDSSGYGLKYRVIREWFSPYIGE